MRTGGSSRCSSLARSHPRITYHEMVEDHREIHRALVNADIFAYPSIWPENACLCLMESMSAALPCVHSNYAALFETAANWTMMYNLHQDLQKHAQDSSQCWKAPFSRCVMTTCGATADCKNPTPIRSIPGRRGPGNGKRGSTASLQRGNPSRLDKRVPHP